MSNLFQELKRRNVFRVAAAYAVISWLVLQIVDTLAEPLGLPEWTISLVFLLLLIGFPIAVIFAWVFELTDQGLKKTEQVEPGASIASSTGQKLNIVISAFLAVALGYFIWESRFADRSVPEVEVADSVATTPAAVAEVISDKSIAVLPFADFSPEGDQAWFADGLSEEILNALVKTRDLNVASRTSSFAYRGSELDVPEIANELGVAHILEGSVRRSDTRLRVTAQLIRASDGFHLWSENYDRSPDDAIAIQEDLAINISRALQTAMDPEALAAMQNVGTDSVAAYNAYLQGLAFEPNCHQSAAPQCLASYTQAITIDPQFAEAHFRLATLWSRNLDITLIRYDFGLSYQEIYNRFQEQISLAIENADNDVDVLKYRASQARVDLRLNDYRDYLQQYLEQRPNDLQSLVSLISAEIELGNPVSAIDLLGTYLDRPESIRDSSMPIILSYRTGDMDRTRELALSTMRDNRDVGVLYQAHRGLLWAGNVEDAATALRLYQQASNSIDAGRLGDETIRITLTGIRQACAEGRDADAIQMYEENIGALQADTGGITTHWLALDTLGRKAEAAALLEQYNNPDTVLQLYSFYNYPQFDPRPYPYLMQVLERENITPKSVTPIPFACGA